MINNITTRIMFTTTSRVCSDCNERTIVGACTKLKFKNNAGRNRYEIIFKEKREQNE